MESSKACKSFIVVPVGITAFVGVFKRCNPRNNLIDCVPSPPAAISFSQYLGHTVFTHFCWVTHLVLFRKLTAQSPASSFRRRPIIHPDLSSIFHCFLRIQMLDYKLSKAFLFHVNSLLKSSSKPHLFTSILGFVLFQLLRQSFTSNY